MAGINNRLKMIADNIIKGQTMADIGTDHGFLPRYLWEAGKCPEIIMTDLSERSLAKAKKTFEKYPGAKGIDFRVGSGLRVLNENEVDLVVLAGMGGVLMTSILGENPCKTISFSKYILQPRNGSGKLRYWLKESGFSIVSEELAEEGKFICEMIAVTPPRNFKNPPSLKNYKEDIKNEVPQHLKEESKELLTMYIKRKLNTEKDILEELKARNTNGSGKAAATEGRIMFLEDILKETLKNDGN